MRSSNRLNNIGALRRWPVHNNILSHLTTLCSSSINCRDCTGMHF